MQNTPKVRCESQNSKAKNYKKIDDKFDLEMTRTDKIGFKILQIVKLLVVCLCFSKFTAFMSNFWSFPCQNFIAIHFQRTQTKPLFKMVQKTVKHYKSKNIQKFKFKLLVS